MATCTNLHARRGANLITSTRSLLQQRARGDDVVLREDQWTLNRLTLQGALRYDHPWSWFPAVTQPKSTFSRAPIPRADGVTGYNDITPRHWRRV